MTPIIPDIEEANILTKTCFNISLATTAFIVS